MYSTPLSKSHGASQIAYLAQHFEDLQGYRYTPLWAAWLLLSSLIEMGKVSQAHFGGIEFGILLIWFTAWLPWSKRWYRLRYGTVVTDRKSDKWSWYLVTAFLLFSIAVPLFHLDAYRDSLNLWPILLYVSPATLQLPPADRALRFRFALYLLATVSLLVVLPCWPALGLSAQTVLAGMCAPLLAMSMYDHWLLNHLLRNAHGPLYV